jgi:hypothetical protein
VGVHTGDNVRVDSLAQWWSQGERVRLALLGGQDREIFVRRLGTGPAMTLLHGFPSSSHDWAELAPALAERHSLLMRTGRCWKRPSASPPRFSGAVRESRWHGIVCAMSAIQKRPFRSGTSAWPKCSLQRVRLNVIARP